MSVPETTDETPEIVAAAFQAVETARVHTLMHSPSFRYIVRCAASHGLTVPELAQVARLGHDQVQNILDPLEDVA